MRRLTTAPPFLAIYDVAVSICVKSALHVCRITGGHIWFWERNPKEPQVSYKLTTHTCYTKTISSDKFCSGSFQCSISSQVQLQQYPHLVFLWFFILTVIKLKKMK